MRSPESLFLVILCAHVQGEGDLMDILVLLKVSSKENRTSMKVAWWNCQLLPP